MQLESFCTCHSHDLVQDRPLSVQTWLSMDTLCRALVLALWPCTKANLAQALRDFKMVLCLVWKEQAIKACCASQQGKHGVLPCFSSTLSSGLQAPVRLQLMGLDARPHCERWSYAECSHAEPCSYQEWTALYIFGNVIPQGCLIALTRNKLIYILNRKVEENTTIWLCRLFLHKAQTRSGILWHLSNATISWHEVQLKRKPDLHLDFCKFLTEDMQSTEITVYLCKIILFDFNVSLLCFTSAWKIPNLTFSSLICTSHVWTNFMI